MPSWLSGRVNESRAGRTGTGRPSTSRVSASSGGATIGVAGVMRASTPSIAQAVSTRTSSRALLGLEVVGRRQRRPGLEPVKHRWLVAWRLVVDPLAVDGRRLDELDDGVDRVEVL